jgi:hypothetical protein
LRFIPEDPQCDAHACFDAIRAIESVRSASALTKGGMGRSFSILPLKSGQVIDVQFVELGE